MRGLGDFKHLLTLYGKGPTGRATERLGTIYAAKRTATGKEFLELGAVHQQRAAIFTLRKPTAWQLDAGLEAEDAQGTRWRCLDITPNASYGTFLDLRCVSTQLEGIGYV